MLSNVEDGKLTHVIAKYHSLSDSDDKGVEGPAFNAHFIKFAAFAWNKLSSNIPYTYCK